MLKEIINWSPKLINDAVKLPGINLSLAGGNKIKLMTMATNASKKA